ncbi:hypothetical protein JCM3766R1_003337 [Sporobolomyces carnicolor]
MSGVPKTQSETGQEELTPSRLATSWKKSGQFDKLRKRLLTDFLSSAEKDRLVHDLDAILPTLLASAHPPIARIPRKDRPAHVLEALDRRTEQREPLLEQDVSAVRARLTRQDRSTGTSRGLGRTVERELRGCMSRHRNADPVREIKDDDPDSLEEEGAIDDDEPRETSASRSVAVVDAGPIVTREPLNEP